MPLGESRSWLMRGLKTFQPISTGVWRSIFYDGPSLADKLRKDGSLRPKRRTTEKQEECEVVNGDEGA